MTAANRNSNPLMGYCRRCGRSFDGGLPRVQYANYALCMACYEAVEAEEEEERENERERRADRLEKAWHMGQKL